MDYEDADYSMECNLNCANVIIAPVGFITVTVNNSAHISRVSNHSAAAPPRFTAAKFRERAELATRGKNALRINASLNPDVTN